MQISVQCMGVDSLWSQRLLHNKSYFMNFRRWNYNCAFYYCYLIMEKHFKFVRTGNLPALVPNATPLVGRFFGKMSNKRQF
jgi:hypothetical protein